MKRKPKKIDWDSIPFGNEGKTLGDIDRQISKLLKKQSKPKKVSRKLLQKRHGTPKEYREMILRIVPSVLTQTEALQLIKQYNQLWKQSKDENA